MADPPAPTYADRLSVETDTANSRAGTVDNSEIVCTPAGSVEVSAQAFESSASSDEENRNEENTTEPVPPRQLMRRDMVRYRRPKKEKESPGTEPLISDDEEVRTSPLLHLPLPPADGVKKRGSFSSKTSTSTPSSASKKAALLAQKAERYSSLKKRKGPNALLNRLFCSNPVDTADTTSTDLARSPRSNSKSPRSPQREQAYSDDDDEDSCGDCMQLFTRANESFTLHDEGKIRSTVQETIADLGCGTVGLSSPPTTTRNFRQISHTPSGDESLCFSVPEVKLVGEAAIGASGRPHHAPGRRNKSHPTDEDSTSIATPKTKLSMAYADDIASPSKREASKKSKSKRKTVKTPGGLVIPSPFKNSSQKLAKSSSSEKKQANQTCRKSPPRPSAKSSRKSSSPVKKRAKDRSPTGMSLAMSTVSTAETSTSGKHSDEMTASPPEMIRIASSLEDLRTVPEATGSNEKSSDETSNSTGPLLKSQSAEMLARVQEELRDDVREENQSRSQMPVSAEDETMAPGSNEMIRELQEQVQLSNRLAQMRLEEIERLESTMDEMRERQVENSDIQRMKERLDQIQEEKIKAVEQAKHEMQVLMEKKIQVLMKTEESRVSQEEKKEENDRSVDTDGGNAREGSPDGISGEIELKGSGDVVILSNSKEEIVELMPAKNSSNSKSASKGSQINEAESRENVMFVDASTMTSAPVEVEVTNSADKVLSERKVTSKSSQIADYERESLRSQITMLEDQASAMIAEHEEALIDLKRASENEIERVRVDMEARMQKQLEKERQLKATLSEASSREKEELLERIDNLQAEKTTERSTGLREVQRKEDLVRQIEVLTTKGKELVDLHQQALHDLRTKHELELQQIDTHIEQLSGSGSSSFESDPNRLTVEILTQKLEKVQAELEGHSEQTKQLTFEKDEAIRELSERMTDALVAEENKRKEVEEEFARATQQAKSDTEMYEKRIELAQKVADEKIAKLQEDFDARSGVEEAMQITTNENDELKEKIRLLQQESEKSTEQLKVEHEKSRLAMETEFAGNLRSVQDEGLRQMVQAQASHKFQMEQVDEKHRAEIISLSKHHGQEIACLEEKIASSKRIFEMKLRDANEKVKVVTRDSQDLVTKLQTKEKELHDLQTGKQGVESSVKRELDETKVLLREKEKELRSVTSTHNEQFEDLLSQLDLVESDHKHLIESKDKIISEKELAIDGLGSQLREVENKTKELQRNLVIEEEKTFKLQRRCSDLETQLKTSKSELVALTETYEKFIEDSALEQERACEAARQDMITRAEMQFEKANEHYITLRKQYDESQAKIKKLEVDLRNAKRRSEKLLSEKAAKEDDLDAKMAMLNASIAKTEADAAQTKKEYRRDLDKALRQSADLSSQLEEEKRASQELRSQLSLLGSQNLKLKKEYDEMKSVSEELMTIIEGQDQTNG